MTVRNVKKNLAGQQDLLPGVGPYNQIRRGVAVSMDGPAKSYIELWKSYCGDAYVGTFEDGFTAVTGDVAVSLTLGSAYRYIGATQVTVAKDSSPSISWSKLVVSTDSLLAVEALRRSYAEAGYNVVGTFQAGFIIVNANDVGIDEVTGKGFTGPAGPVVARTNPASGGFVDVSGAISRNQIAASSGSGLVGHGGGTVKSALDYIMMSYPLDATDYLPDGYVTDGSVSYTTELQQAFNDAAGYRAVLLPNFQVLIDPAGTTYGGLQVPSSSKFIFQAGSSLKIKPNNLSNYEIIGIHDKQNIELFNPVIYGDKYTHTGTSGEWGMGISIRGACENIRIYNPRVYECWGDGYYIGQTSETVGSTPKNIHIINPEAWRCRRQGMSVTSADGLFITNPGFWDTKSSDSPTALPGGPHAGIDIEPNSVNSALRNIKIKGLHGGRNDGGLFYVFLGAIVTEPGNRYHVDIDVDSISDDGSHVVVNCIGLNENSRYSGAISIGSVNSDISGICPVQLRNWPVQCRLPVNITTATLSNWKSPVGSPARDRAAVTVRYAGSDPAYPAVGNLHIGQLNLISTRSAESLAASAVFFENASGAGVRAVTIKMGYVFANTDLRCEGFAKADIDLGNVFGETFKFKRDISWTFLPNILGDIEVTPSAATPTCTMPDVYPSLAEGNSYRFKYFQVGAVSYVRIRSAVVPMYCNGIQGTNFLIHEASGVVTLYIRGGAYYLHSLGPVTKES